MLETAVLFLIFNRPEIAKRSFNAIRNARPKRLYIAADGPRRNHPNDVELCAKAREISGQIDWECEVKVLFRDENLGCQRAVSTAIDWFFDSEVEGIILEDDCLASQSFFRYCSELLDYYRDNKQVICVSGNNFQQGKNVTDYSYYFSRYPHCWGWATWRTSWSLYDTEMDHWDKKRNVGVIEQWSDSTDEFCSYWENAFDEAASGKVDSWAYRWLYSCWKNRGLTCLPQKNLVKNIGFDAQATHTNNSEVWYSMLEHNNISFPLKHPRKIQRDVKADIYTDINVYGILCREKLNIFGYFSHMFTSLKMISKRGI